MARLAGVSANITRLSIQPVYAKYPDAGYLLLPASALGNGPDGPLSTTTTTEHGCGFSGVIPDYAASW
jgi:hypothetical protein